MLATHGVVGARMIEGIDFLDEERSGIRHQHEYFDGRGSPASLGGTAIPPPRGSSPWRPASPLSPSGTRTDRR